MDELPILDEEYEDVEVNDFFDSINEAAAAAAALFELGRPAVPASVGITVQVFSSATTFCPKLVKTLDRAVLMRPSSALPAASSAAPKGLPAAVRIALSALASADAD